MKPRGTCVCVNDLTIRPIGTRCSSSRDESNNRILTNDNMEVSDPTPSNLQIKGLEARLEFKRLCEKYFGESDPTPVRRSGRISYEVSNKGGIV